jgi:hypothetical protein
MTSSLSRETNLEKEVELKGGDNNSRIELKEN